VSLVLAFASPHLCYCRIYEPSVPMSYLDHCCCVWRGERRIVSDTRLCIALCGSGISGVIIGISFLGYVAFGCFPTCLWCLGSYASRTVNASVTCKTCWCEIKQTLVGNQEERQPLISSFEDRDTEQLIGRKIVVPACVVAVKVILVGVGRP